ncbi:FliM/FliN family flagellar motor switch protein [Janthinobacterium sp. GB4P2]|uniref:FliM/FliN family flagellar motor switch protein n=1 Tax=Janthinobacterium sp. GB4P2 TaxID=3424189 RepID=UPI003F2574DF
MVVHAYTLLGNATLARLQDLLAQAARQWCAAWGVSREALQVDCGRAWEMNARVRAVLVATERHGGSWMAWPGDSLSHLQDAMFLPQSGAFTSAETACAIASGVALEAATALRACMAKALAPGVPDAAVLREAPPPSLFQAGSGAVCIALSVGKFTLRCVLDAATVRTLATSVPAARLAPLQRIDYRKALQQVAVSLPVDIGRADVGLGSLMTLGVGDVIRLDRSAELPLAVRGAQGSILFSGYLGSDNGQLALTIAQPQSSSTESP